jgi:ribonuclease P protein component
LIWRLRARRDFTQLSSEGRRARAGVLWCTYLHDSTDLPPRVAFAVGRAVGPAVVRNQLRRRLRALLASSDPDLTLPSGSFLIGATPAAGTRSFVELQFDLRQLVQRVRG